MVLTLVLGAWGYKCGYCGKELSFYDATLDHRIPRSKGGRNTIENMVPSCYRCNQAKGTMSATEFMELRGQEATAAIFR